MGRGNDDSVHVARLCLALCVLAALKVGSTASLLGCATLCADAAVSNWLVASRGWMDVLGAAAAFMFFSAYFVAAGLVIQRAAIGVAMVYQGLVVCFAFWPIAPAAHGWVTIAFSAAVALLSCASVATQLGALRRTSEE